MADNTELNAGTGGDVISTDDLGGGIKVQRVKVQHGADGSATDVSAASPMPVGDAGGSLTVDSPQLPAALGAQGALKVEGVASGTPVPVSGTVELGAAALAALETITVAGVTAPIPAGDNNIGNVDVASSALPTGASTEAKQDTQITHEAAIRTAVEIVDDWDESDRAKVNIIAGQAGITGGAGAVAANTPRVTHASDDPAVVALQLIDNPVKVDDVAFTPATDSVMMVGAQCDDDSTDLVDEGDAGALRMTKERKLRAVTALDSAAMQSGNDEVIPKFASIAVSSSGDNSLVSGVGSKKIRVLAYVLSFSAAVNAKWRSSTTDKTGLIYGAANGGAIAGFNPVGWLETVAGEALNLNLSGAVPVGGHLTYIEVD